MTTCGVRWWTLLVTMVTVVRVAAGVTSGLVVDVDTCTCTERSAACTISEMNDQHHTWDRSERIPAAPRDLQVEVKDGPNNTPTIDITWLPPKGESLTFLNGFSVDLSLPDASFQLLHVSVPSTPTTESQWNLRCTTKNVIYATSLLVVTASLPRPNDPKDLARSTEIRVTVPLPKNMKTDNAFHWKPVVTTETREQSLIVKFSLPEQLKDKISGFQISFEPSNTIPEQEVTPNTTTVQAAFHIPQSQRSTCFTIRIIKVCMGCINQGNKFCQMSNIKGDCSRPSRISTNGSLTGSCGMTRTTPLPIVDDNEMTPSGELISMLPDDGNALRVQVMVPLVVLTAVIINTR